MRRGSISVLVCLLGLWLGGCGEDPDVPSTATGSSETPGSGTDGPETETTSAPPHEGPACDKVWVDGGDLPRNYRGCLEGEDWVRAAIERCASGQVLVTYADRYYGAKGAVVNDVGAPLEQNKQYQQARKSCGG